MGKVEVIVRETRAAFSRPQKGCPQNRREDAVPLQATSWAVSCQTVIGVLSSDNFASCQGTNLVGQSTSSHTCGVSRSNERWLLSALTLNIPCYNQLHLLKHAGSSGSDSVQRVQQRWRCQSSRPTPPRHTCCPTISNRID